jgi:hypothetical protein
MGELARSPVWFTFTRVMLQHDATRWKTFREIRRHRVAVTYLAY